MAFLKLECLDAFYGGSAGGGKSDALLMAALQYVDIPGYNALLIRDTYSNLTKPEGLMTRADEWLIGRDVHWDDNSKTWTFPSGATLSFGYLDGPKDHYNFQGAAYQFVGIDEMVNIRENQSLYLFSRLRKRESESYLEDLKKLPKYQDKTQKQLDDYYEQYKNIPLRFRGASNPPQREQVERGAYVKKRYVDEETRGDRVFVPAKLRDNPHLDAESYKKSLDQLDPITRAQLLDGDWNIKVKGRMFDRSWFEIVEAAPENIQWVRFWDRAATEEKQNTEKQPAYTAGCKMGVKDGIYYIKSMARFRKSSRGNETTIRQIADTDGTGVHIGIEQEPGSSGKDVIDHYRRRILPGFVLEEYPASNAGSKIQRAAPVASQAEAGNIKLVKGAWNEDYLSEIELFPDGEFKDQVDATSGAFKMILKGKTVRIRSI